MSSQEPTGLQALASLAFLVWWVYAISCILNHFGVWPFSYLGAG